MSHTIEDEVRKIIAGVGRSKGADPVLGIAVADVESGFNPHAVGDTNTEYASFGVFQERLRVGRGGFTTPDPDPARQADRFYDDVLRYMRAGGAGTPGEIAAAVQRPELVDKDKSGVPDYIEDVNRRYRFHMSDPEIRSEPGGGGGPSTCPPGQVRDPRTGSCGYVGRGGFIPAGSEPERHPGLAGTERSGSGGALPPGSGPILSAGGRGAATFDPLGGVADAIDRARQGAVQVVIGVAVVGTAIALGYTGVRKMLG